MTNKTAEKRGFIRNYITSGLDTEERLLYRVKLINLFSLVGILSLLVFGAYRVFLGDYVGAMIELSIAGIGVLNVVTLRRLANIDIATTIILFFMLVILVYLVIDGGVRGTGLFWLYLYPLLAFFLKEKREASGWVVSLYGLIILLLVADKFEYVKLPFDSFTIVQAMISLFAVTLLVYFYAVVDERNDLVLKNKTREIALFNEKLVGEVFKHDSESRE